MRSLLSLALTAGLALAVGCDDDDPPTGVDAGAMPADAGAEATDAGDAPADAGDAEDDGGADAGEAPADGGAGETTYYVVRHAERDPGLDPPINAEGMVRARALADRLETAGIDEIVTTRFIRGQQSGQPLADRLDQTITVAPFEWDGWVAFAEDVWAWQRDREVPGRTYLMIGHSGGYNSTLLEGLGATVPAGTGERYEDLVILVRAADGTVTVTEETYGGPSSLDP